ncbi:MAG: four-carbon acid sugar kinase family protein, partial [Oscillospiraceae bacterium]|nr:four-carbon acid sugar kinase family protein [Oscillospiraceae bacterium]
RLLLAGSCSEMTQRQIRRYVEAGGLAVKVEPLALLDGRQTARGLSEVFAQAAGDVLFYSSDSAEQVERNQRLGAERVSAVLEESMGELARDAAERGCTHIVVAGGETSGRVMLSLGYDAFEILEDVAPGVPRMAPVEEPALSLALKSGNFGAEDFFLTALN